MKFYFPIHNLIWPFQSFKTFFYTQTNRPTDRPTDRRTEGQTYLQKLRGRSLKIAKLRQSCDSFCVHNLQKITFVCTTAIDNILSTTPIVNFCMPYCNCQHFYGTTTFVWTIATITINITLLQLLTFKCPMVIDNFLWTIAIDYFCLDYCN